MKKVLKEEARRKKRGSSHIIDKDLWFMPWRWGGQRQFFEDVACPASWDLFLKSGNNQVGEWEQSWKWLRKEDVEYKGILKKAKALDTSILGIPVSLWTMFCRLAAEVLYQAWT